MEATIDLQRQASMHHGELRPDLCLWGSVPLLVLEADFKFQSYKK